MTFNSCGSSIGTMMAMSDNTARKPSAVSAARLRFNICQPSGRAIRAGAAASGIEFDAFVQQRVDHVHEQVEEHEQHAVNDDRTAEQEDIAVLN